MKTLPLTTKKGKEKEWQQALKNNQEGYGWAVIEVISKLGKNLDDGMEPAEAEDLAVKGSGITGFQAGVMASMIKQLHPRGEEFNKHWNGIWGMSDSKGTVNPAIVTVAEKKKKDIKPGTQ